MLVPYLFVFWVGAIIGSFLNVVGIRFLKDEDIVFQRSHCTACNAKIRPWDNIPILSWLILGARCRDCKAPIHWQYPLVELTTALLFLATVHVFGFTWQTALLLYLICNFMVVLITDFREQVIFDYNSIGLIPFGLAYSWLNLGQVPGTYTLPGVGWTIPWALASSVLAVGAVALVFFGINWILRLFVLLLFRVSPGQVTPFALGDVYLLMGIGAFFGLKWSLIILVLAIPIQVIPALPIMMWQWYREKAYRSLVYTLGCLLCIGLLYCNRVFVTDALLAIVLSLVLSVAAIIMTLLMLRQAFRTPVGFTVMPFGPPLIAATLCLLFFTQPVLTITDQYTAYLSKAFGH